MRIRGLTVIVLAAGFLAIPSRTGCQVRGPADPAVFLDTLPARTILRVETLARSTFFGRYLAFGADTLTISSPRAAGHRRVALDSVSRLWIQDGTKALPVGLVGAIVGAVTVGGLAYSLSGLDGGDDCRWCEVPKGVAIGAVLGSLTGAGVGLLIPDWRPVYAR